MEDAGGRYLPAMRKLLSRSDGLAAAARRAWLRLRKDPGAKTVTLPPCPFADARDLFLNCVRMRGRKLSLDCAGLRSALGGEFPEWMRRLQEAGGFAVPQEDHSRDELFHRLCFELPGVDWLEFRGELRAGMDVGLLKDAFLAAEHLAGCPEAAAPAEWGARLFHDSKRLKNPTLLAWVCRFLRQKNGIGGECPDAEVLEKFGFTPNPTASTVMLYGPFRYESGGERADWVEALWRRGQSAILSCDNLRGMGRVSVGRPVLTVENETVFNRMKRGGGDWALVYTAGFPGRAVRKWIAALDAGTPLCHWGDGDPEGYEIAAILHAIHPLRLFRCAAADLERMKASARPLPDAKWKRALRLEKTPGFPFPDEIAWILRNRLWIEQESFFAD